jgi:DNA-binding GntR family transcriptional regulator
MTSTAEVAEFFLRNIMTTRHLNDTIKQIARPKSLTETAVEYLRTAIINGDLGLGQPVSESTLATSLGISKTPVREALARLKIEGLVKIFPQKGTFIFTMSEQEVIDICELRYLLESEALKLAIRRNKQAFLSEMNEVVAKMTRTRKEIKKSKYLDLDTDQFIDDAYRLIVARVIAVRTHLAAVPHHTEKSYDEHTRMCRLIEEDRIDETLKILDKHITRTKESAALHIPKYSL